MGDFFFHVDLDNFGVILFWKIFGGNSANTNWTAAEEKYIWPCK